MPIKGLTENRRIPRLGKIHTGIKKKNKSGVEYPVAVDYFVFPETALEHVEAAYGTRQPKELPIMIPVEDEERWCSQYYRSYSKTRGLICKGDGENAARLVDAKTGDMTWKDDATEVVMVEVPCMGKDCGDYINGRCKEMMMLQFLLPDLDGLGIWQIDTGSINAILNVNSAAELIRRVHGRVSMIPLILKLEYQTVKTPEGKQRSMPIIGLHIAGTLNQFIASRDVLALPEGEEIEEPDENYPELVAPDAQAPEGEEPDPEIDMPEVSRGKPKVNTPKAVETSDKICTWDEFMAIAIVLTGETAPSKVAGLLGVKQFGEWTGTKEEALDEIGALVEKDWRGL